MLSMIPGTSLSVSIQITRVNDKFGILRAHGTPSSVSIQIIWVNECLGFQGLTVLVFHWAYR